MLIKTWRRPIRSESQAHRKRPDALKTPIRLTKVVARASEATSLVVKGTPRASSASGLACEIIAMPAVTFKARMAQRTYHWPRESACDGVKSRAARCAVCLAEGVQPAGT